MVQTWKATKSWRFAAPSLTPKELSCFSKKVPATMLSRSPTRARLVSWYRTRTWTTIFSSRVGIRAMVSSVALILRSTSLRRATRAMRALKSLAKTRITGTAWARCWKSLGPRGLWLTRILSEGSWATFWRKLATTRWCRAGSTGRHVILARPSLFSSRVHMRKKTD